MAESRAKASSDSAVPDVLAPGLRCVFCGINPGRVSAGAHAHFANPRNDFWRLLHEGGFTPRLLEPAEQFELLEFGYGVTNAAYRTTPGSSDLRRSDFDGSRLEQLAIELRPLAIAFVGKEAYRGALNDRADHGPQLRALGSSGLYVLPSTSPANAAVPWDERLRWFQSLHDWLEPTDRQAVRALVVDAADRVLLLRFESPVSRRSWWITPGGGIDGGETPEKALRRELVEETGLQGQDPGRVVWTRTHVLPWGAQLWRQHERFYLVRVESHEHAPGIDLAPEHIVEARWWTLDELDATDETVGPPMLAHELRRLLRDGTPPEPINLAG